MKKSVLRIKLAGITFLFLLLSLFSFGQSQAFVFGGGLTIGTQRWDNSFQRQPLFQWHGTLAIESVNNDNDNASLFAQIGYHVKGSAVRFQFWNLSGSNAFVTTERFKFNNISLLLGAKQKFPLGSGDSKYFYFGGIRGDYTVSTNLNELAQDNRIKSNPSLLYIYPSEAFVRHLMGGVSLGAGIQVPMTDLIGMELKLAIHPDFTVQYRQPAIRNIIDPNNPSGSNTSISSREIRNTTLELSLCLRLLRKVVYED